MDQEKRIKQLKGQQESLTEFKNTRMVKKKELDNEEARYKVLLR